MNSPRQTACFAKGMQNYTFSTLNSTFFFIKVQGKSRTMDTQTHSSPGADGDPVAMKEAEDFSLFS